MAAPARGRSSRTRTRGAGRWPANASRDTVRRCRSGLDPAAFDGQMSAARTAGLERLRAHGPYASPPPPRRVDLVRCGNATSARVGARSFRECSLLCQAAIAICDESGSARGCRLEGEIWGCDGSRAAAQEQIAGISLNPALKLDFARSGAPLLAGSLPYGVRTFLSSDIRSRFKFVI